MLTKKSKYGLIAVLALADQAGSGPVLVSELAASQGLPKKFLEAILLELKRHGLLHSKKGKGGGYLLGRAPAAITVGEVIRVLDGPLALVPCVSQTAYRPCEECLDEEACGVRLAMKEVRDATARILDHTTIQGLNGRVARARHRKGATPPRPAPSVALTPRAPRAKKKSV